MTRRRPLVAALAVVGMAVVGAVLVGRGGDDDVRAGSMKTGGSPVEIGEPPLTYRIDYRVVARGGGDEVVTSDRLLVRRPFESRLESYDDAVPRGDPASIQVARLGRLLLDGPGRNAVVAVRPPAPGASDLRVDAVLDDALDAGVLERRERREVLGRPCQVYRSAAPLTTHALSRAGDASEHADTCVDADGLVLEEVLVDDGDVLLRRVAIDVEVDPALTDEQFETGEPTVPENLGGGLWRELTPTSRTPGRFFEPELPPGFDRAGRYAVVPGGEPDPSGLPITSQRRVTFVSDVLADERDVIVIDQGSTTDGSQALPGAPDGARTVEIDAIGTFTVVLDARAAAVQVDLGDGDFLRISGTVPVGRLLDVARSLERTGGGTLVPSERPSG